MNLPFDWDSISKLAAVVPLWFGVFVIASWIRDVLGSRLDRSRARSDAFKHWEVERQIVGLQREATRILRQIEEEPPSGALVKAKRADHIDVHSSKIRFTSENKPVLELDTPGAKIHLDEERIRTLIKNNAFFNHLLDNPQAFRFLLENPETLGLLRQLMKKAAVRAD